MAEKNNANIGFEKQIWDAACVLWGHIPAAEYRKVIIGLIFLRYISSAFERKYNELVAEGEGFEEDRDEYLARIFSSFRRKQDGLPLQLRLTLRKSAQFLMKQCERLKQKTNL